MQAKSVALPAGDDGIDARACDRERLERALKAFPSVQGLLGVADRWVGEKLQEFKAMLGGLDAGRELSGEERRRLLWLERLGNAGFKSWPYDAYFIGKGRRDLSLHVRIAASGAGFCVCAVGGSLGDVYRRLSAEGWGSRKEAVKALEAGAWRLKRESGVVLKDGDVIAAWTEGGTLEEARRELERDLGLPVRAQREEKSGGLISAP